MIVSPPTRAHRAAPDPEHPPPRGRDVALVAAWEATHVQDRFTSGASGAAVDEVRGRQLHLADDAGGGGAAADAAAAGDIDRRKRAVCAGEATIGGQPKRRRLRGKQPRTAAIVISEADVNAADSSRINRRTHHAARDDTEDASRVANSVHDMVSGGPSRLDTFTSYRYVPRLNRDGHVLNLGAVASVAQWTGLTERDREVLVLGHAAGTGRPPDGASSSCADRSLG